MIELKTGLSDQRGKSVTAVPVNCSCRLIKYLFFIISRKRLLFDQEFQMFCAMKFMIFP